jgi:vacuolar-type H+-ATPase subunit E/Vma4
MAKDEQNEEQKDTQTLISEMKERAESQREEILSEARQKRDQTLQQADSRVETMRQEAKDRLASELRAEHDRILGLSRMEKRNEQLAVRRRYVSEVFDKAEEQLTSKFEGGDFSRLLYGLVKEALDEIRTSDVTLTVSERDKSEGERIAKELGISGGVETKDAEPGTAVLTTSDGLRSVDNSISTRLRLARRELVSDVAGVLFGGGDHG